MSLCFLCIKTIHGQLAHPQESGISANGIVDASPQQDAAHATEETIYRESKEQGKDCVDCVADDDLSPSALIHTNEDKGMHETKAHVSYKDERNRVADKDMIENGRTGGKTSRISLLRQRAISDDMKDTAAQAPPHDDETDNDANQDEGGSATQVIRKLIGRGLTWAGFPSYPFPKPPQAPPPTSAPVDCRCEYPDGYEVERIRSGRNYNARSSFRNYPGGRALTEILVLPNYHESCQHVNWICPGDTPTGPIWKCPLNGHPSWRRGLGKRRLMSMMSTSGGNNKSMMGMSTGRGDNVMGGQMSMESMGMSTGKGDNGMGGQMGMESMGMSTGKGNSGMGGQMGMKSMGMSTGKGNSGMGGQMSMKSMGMSTGKGNSGMGGQMSMKSMGMSTGKGNSGMGGQMGMKSMGMSTGNRSMGMMGMGTSMYMAPMKMRPMNMSPMYKPPMYQRPMRKPPMQMMMMNGMGGTVKPGNPRRSNIYLPPDHPRCTTPTPTERPTPEPPTGKAPEPPTPEPPTPKPPTPKPPTPTSETPTTEPPMPTTEPPTTEPPTPTTEPPTTEPPTTEPPTTEPPTTGGQPSPGGEPYSWR